jgi:hypothetical protein
VTLTVALYHPILSLTPSTCLDPPRMLFFLRIPPSSFASSLSHTPAVSSFLISNRALGSLDQGNAIFQRRQIE